MSKMASKDDPHPSNCFRYRGGVHSNQPGAGDYTGYQPEIRVFKGTCYCQVKLVKATEMDLVAVAKELVKRQEYRMALLSHKIKVLTVNAGSICIDR
jgi:hypothetical protein